MKTRINHAAVWVLVVVHQLIGFGWYTVFGNLWLNLHAKTMTDIDKPNDPMPYVVAIVASIVVNYALACLLVVWEKRLRWAALRSLSFAGFHSSSSNTPRFQLFPPSAQTHGPLVFLDTGRALLAFAVSGLLLGGWQRKSSSQSGGGTSSPAGP